MTLLNLPDGLAVRNAAPADHKNIIAVMKDWWGGRDLSHMLPRLFLEHFCDTSWIIEKNNTMVGFLIGFLSQYQKNVGYIHFAGIHPQFRAMGIGTFLYERFYDFCRKNGRNTVRSCTSPVNKGSIGFHTRLGFEIEKGDTEMDGVSVTRHYNRLNDPKVLFKKSI